ncbi:heparan sulfate glucosamine 3-O-sulfotransferase 3B1-like [Saccoglossus kowalevskii]|uniref:Heparan sulfate glucosamine 3-O-sulfotransferase 3B1-like n=1 Tax=Saccoglossus kowalevskii TaxID=10224 RepID=A0ABM0MYR5_SACKO|nr:PREDICTED: heparan sulfate glucosamine 3-O-sulfotransferase 3B1-like [Saccoglossus kowalevskii]
MHDRLIQEGSHLKTIGQGDSHVGSTRCRLYVLISETYEKMYRYYRDIRWQAILDNIKIFVSVNDKSTDRLKGRNTNIRPVYIMMVLVLGIVLFMILTRSHLASSEISSMSTGTLGKLVKFPHCQFTAGAKRCIPDVIIIGAIKCGAQALLEFLDVHPQIAAVRLETHFFDKGFDKGYNWYLNLMPISSSKDKRTIEKTSTYYLSEENPIRIHASLSEHCKLIFVVCDPIQRALSHYAYMFNFYRKSGTLAKIIEDNRYDGILKTFGSTVLNLDQQSVNETRLIVKAGMYAPVLHKWLDQFDKKQILIVDGNTLASSPAKELQLVENFIALKPFFRDDNFQLNQANNLSCMVKPVEHCVTLPSIAPTDMHVPDVEYEVIQMLKSFYMPFNKELQEFCGRLFSWA